MKIRSLPYRLTVCKLDHIEELTGFYSLTVTGEEISLVCETDRTPQGILAREDGWRTFKVEGPLDFSLVGILARISSCLAERAIPLFALSTYDTDYVLVKEQCFEESLAALKEKGFTII